MIDRVAGVVDFVRTIPKSCEAVQALRHRPALLSTSCSPPSKARRLGDDIDRSAPQKHVWRANIILATADGCGTAIMRRSGKSKPVVGMWQARSVGRTIEGLTHDKTRTPGKRPLSTDTVQRVVDLALGPAGKKTH